MASKRNSSRRFKVCLLLATAAAVLSIVRGEEPARQGARAPAEALTAAEEARLAQARADVFASLPAEELADFYRLAAPSAEEWPGPYKEIPQTFERFAGIEAPRRPTGARRTIVLQPLGEFNREQRKRLEILKDYAAVFFRLPTRLEKPIELKVDDPKVALARQLPMGQRRDGYTQQFDASAILKHILSPRIPDDALVYVGITNEDLFVGQLTFVFGLAHPSDPVTVFSLCRYEPEFSGRERQPGDEVQILRRALKVLNHECSHVLRLRHCVFFHCTMNYSNTLTELDNTPVHLCPVCHRKLCWLLGWDAEKRYEKLRDFYTHHKLESEAEWLTARITHWRELEHRKETAKVHDNE